MFVITSCESCMYAMPVVLSQGVKHDELAVGYDGNVKATIANMHNTVFSSVYISPFKSANYSTLRQCCFYIVNYVAKVKNTIIA